MNPRKLFDICKRLAVSFDYYLSTKVFKEVSTGFDRLEKAIADADKKDNGNDS